MQIENFKLQKGTFTLDVKDIDFSNIGIYLLKGKNGSGKTTFIETILKKDKYLNIKEKSNSISYFSQQLYKYSNNGRKYLEECNQDIVKKYCELLSVDYLYKNIMDISGGEFVKLAIIRCIAKDTPILIFDEPTNNLDNATTDIISLILNELGKYKTVIILTHDDRLKLDYHTLYYFENSRIHKTSKDIHYKKLNINSPLENKKYPILKKLFISRFNIFMAWLIACIVTLLCFVGINYINLNVPLGPKLPSDNFIELLYINEPCSSYIKATVSPKEYRQKFENAYNHFDKQELLDLSTQDFIDKIYVIDNAYINDLNNDSPELKIFSIPNAITESPYNERAYPGTKGFLISGKLPRDNKYEAVVSYDQMVKHWNYNGDINDIIGKKIKIENEEYAVVGLTNLPITTISYQDNLHMPYGVIEVSNKTDWFLSNMLTQMTLQGYPSSGLFYRNIFIAYKEGKTKEIMTYLENYAPSYQYTSNHVLDTLVLYNYKMILPKMLALSFCFSFAFSLLVYIVGQRSFLLIDYFIKDRDNLNFSPKKNASYLYSVLIIDYLIVSPFIILFAYHIMRSVIGLLMLLPFLAISMIMFGISILSLRKRMEKKSG